MALARAGRGCGNLLRCVLRTQQLTQLPPCRSAAASVVGVAASWPRLGEHRGPARQPSQQSGTTSLTPAATVDAPDVDEDLMPTPRIVRADRVNDTTMCIAFSDNTLCNFNFVWLRDSCRCPTCEHPLTRSRRLDCTLFSERIRPQSWTLRDSGALEITWPAQHPDVANSVGDLRQPHVSTFHGEWLYQFRPLFERSSSSLPDAAAQIDDEVYYPRTSVIPWNADQFEEHPPEVDYEEFLTQRSALKNVLKNVVKYGICLLKGVPTTDGELVRAAQRIGFIREVGCGQTFRLTRADAGTYREWAPGVQLLHCIRDAGGGWSPSATAITHRRFVDGFAAAQWLRHSDAAAFAALTQTPVTFSFVDVERDRWHRETHPIITLDSRGHIKQVHYSPASMRPPLLPTDRVAVFYDAFRRFSQRLRDRSLAYPVDLRAGDLVLFNNRRVVEPRSASELAAAAAPSSAAASADVLLSGCYMDAAEILAFYEKIKKDDADGFDA